MGLLEPGTAVLVEGLKARPDLNGKPAVVVAFAAEREPMKNVVAIRFHREIAIATATNWMRWACAEALVILM